MNGVSKKLGWDLQDLKTRHYQKHREHLLDTEVFSIPKLWLQNEFNTTCQSCNFQLFVKGMESCCQTKSERPSIKTKDFHIPHHICIQFLNIRTLQQFALTSNNSSKNRVLDPSVQISSSRMTYYCLYVGMVFLKASLEDSSTCTQILNMIQILCILSSHRWQKHLENIQSKNQHTTLCLYSKEKDMQQVHWAYRTRLKASRFISFNLKVKTSAGCWKLNIGSSACTSAN